MNYETVEDRIISALGKISLEKDVSIIYACESGSRAWGFASKDSDYDVRFVYAKHPDKYLSIDTCGQRDVIDGIDIEWSGEKLDIAGWDLRKALNLFRKGNPPFLEWLHSPIRYVDRFGFRIQCNELAENYLNKQSIVMHYVHMAMGNWKRYLKNDMSDVILKKYLYVVRPLCAAVYLIDEEIRQQIPLPLMPPVDFETLLKSIELPDGIGGAIQVLICAKRDGFELGAGPRIPELDEWISKQEEAWEGFERTRPVLMVPIDELNAEFKRILEVTV
jgi:predicted nucleotidyltransferase